jgi:hypothetical protein
MAKQLNALHYNNVHLHPDILQTPEPKKQKQSAKLSAVASVATVETQDELYDVVLCFENIDRRTAPPSTSPIGTVTAQAVPGGYTVEDMLAGIRDGDITTDPAITLEFDDVDDFSVDPETGARFIKRLEINGISYANTGVRSDIDPESGLYEWEGIDWMYALAPGINPIPTWDPNDPHKYNPIEPADTGDDNYPEAAVNQITIAQIAAKFSKTDPNDPDCYVTFGYEDHIFQYVLEEQTVNGEQKLVATLVLKTVA